MKNPLHTSFLLFALICGMLTGCSGDEGEKQAPTSKSPAKEQSKDASTAKDQKEEPVHGMQTEDVGVPQVMVTLAAGMRLRDQPNQNGKVVESLPPATLLTYLHEKSKKPEQITVSGHKYTAHWLKVRTPGNQTGWIFAGEKPDGGLIQWIVDEGWAKSAAAGKLKQIAFSAKRSSDLEKEFDIKGIRSASSGYSGVWHAKNGKKNGRVVWVASLGKNADQRVTYMGAFEQGKKTGGWMMELYQGKKKGRMVLSYDGIADHCLSREYTEWTDGKQSLKYSEEYRKGICTFDESTIEIDY